MSLISWLRSLFPPPPSGPSIRIVCQARECVDLEYRDATQTLRLSGELVGPKWKQVNLTVPEPQSDEQTLDNIALALRNRGYEFVISRFGEVQTIPQAEQNAALAELQSLGFQIEVSPDRKRVRQSRAPGAPRLSREQAKELAPRIMQLVQTVRGVRRPSAILRKSESALI